MNKPATNKRPALKSRFVNHGRGVLRHFLLTGFPALGFIAGCLTSLGLFDHSPVTTLWVGGGSAAACLVAGLLLRRLVPKPGATGAGAAAAADMASDVPDD